MEAIAIGAVGGDQIMEEKDMCDGTGGMKSTIAWTAVVIMMVLS